MMLGEEVCGGAGRGRARRQEPEADAGETRGVAGKNTVRLWHMPWGGGWNDGRTRWRRESSRSSPQRSCVARFPSFAFALILLTVLLPLCTAANTPCLRFADSDIINNLFTDNGPGAKVFLCPGKLYRLSGTIVFTAADQELATYGYPSGSDRATIRVEGTEVTAVQGDCRRCARVGIRNVIIDGYRRKKGRVKEGVLVQPSGLVVMGGNEGQSVSECWLKDPRGFTALHIREGDKLSCTGAVVERNQFGPIGDEYDPKADGPDPESSPLGRPLADGVSIACKNSQIRDNSFYDNTDAAVVLYCSPGTVVANNRISTRMKSAMAGILMVDSLPWDGDYTGVTIKNNIIDAAGAMIRVGVGIGAAVWSDDTESIIKGGAVVGNTLRGKYLGYGIAAAGLKGWTVTDNLDEAMYVGERGERCFDEPVNPDPMAFVWHEESVTESVFQRDFKSHEFQYLVCIDSPSGAAPQISSPPQLVLPQPDTEPPVTADVSSAVPVLEQEQAPETGQVSFDTGSDVLDALLLMSQQRMLEAISQVPARLGARSEHGGGGAAVIPQSLASRIDALEAQQSVLLEMATSLRATLQKWDLQVSAAQRSELELLSSLRSLLAAQAVEGDPNPPGEQGLNQRLERTGAQSGTSGGGGGTNRARLLRLATRRLGGSGAGWGTTISGLMIVLMLGIGWVGWRRWRRKGHSKSA